MLPLIIILSVFAGLLVIYLLVSLSVYFVIFYSPNKYQKRQGDYLDNPNNNNQINQINDLVKALQNEKFEDVYIKSFDKLKLRGRYYHLCDNAPLAICFHGFRGTPIRDFSGGYQVLKSKGFNVLLVDQRAHIKSKGHTITFGIKEGKDAMSWIKYAINRFGKDIEILLVGISMGGYTVMNTIINEDIPTNVKGAISDCPFHSPKAILKHACIHDTHVPWWIGGFLLRSASIIFGHFSFDKKKYDLTNKKAKVDFMIIHGDSDSIVPYTFSEAFLEANPNSKRYIFKGADHGMSYLINKDLYQKICNDFIDELFK